MVGRWTKKVIEFMCVNEVSDYIRALIFGALFSWIGHLGAFIEFEKVITLKMATAIFLKCFKPLIPRFRTIMMILYFVFAYFLRFVFVYLLNIYAFLWFGANLGNIIGWWVRFKRVPWKVPWKSGDEGKKFLNKKNIFIFNLLVFAIILFIFIKGVLIAFVWEGRRFSSPHSGVNLAFVREERKEKVIYCYLSYEKRLKKIYRITPKEDFIELRWLLFEDKLFLKQFYYTRVDMYTRIRKVGVIDCRSGKVMGVGDVIGRSNLEKVMDALNVKSENEMWERCSLVNIGKKYSYFLYDLDTAPCRGTLLIERRSDGELIKVKDVSCYYPDISPDERYIVYSLGGEDYRKKGEIYLFDIEKREKIFLCKGKYPFFYRGSQEIVYRYNRDEDIFRGELRKYDLREKRFSTFINPSTHKPYPGNLLEGESIIVSDRECLYMLEPRDSNKYPIIEVNLSNGERKMLADEVLFYAVGRSGR